MVSAFFHEQSTTQAKNVQTRIKTEALHKVSRDGPNAATPTGDVDFTEPLPNATALVSITAYDLHHTLVPAALPTSLRTRMDP